MFATPAYAQSVTGGGSEFLFNLLPIILMGVIFYFLLIRPQQQARKRHTQMLEAIRRNDVVITSGGVIGKVSKVIDEHEVEVEISKDTKVRVVRAMIAEVRAKGEPAKAANKK
ncbi:MAG: preprotein translocase subunit YajC [Nitratireductor sp.]